MSRLWPESIRVALSPGRAVGQRLRCNWRRRSSTAAEGDADALRPLLTKLGGRNASVSVTLSNRLVRYLCLPWSSALESEADWQTFAARRFELLFGAKPDAYYIEVATGDRGAARIACAVERTLVDAIRADVRSAGHRLISLRPRFAASFDLVRRRIADGDAWIVDPELGQITVGLAVAGRWRSLRQRRVEEGWQELLPTILQREAQLAGISARIQTVHVLR